MIDAYGGAQRFESKLDSLFNAKNKTSGREQADITGLIGQYAHGNEPSHHIAYLYHSIGKPSKTAERTHQILNDFYKNEPDGLIGNEDCGQMSAWYVLSAMGLYQICPGNPQFEFSTPLFKKVVIHLENDKKFIMNNTSKNRGEKYIQKISTPFDKKAMQVSSEDLSKGGILIYKTTNTLDSVIQNFNRTYETIDTINQIIINPIIKSSQNPFIEVSNITITASANCKIYYTEDGSQPTLESKLYDSPFKLNKSTKISAIAVHQNKASKPAAAYVHQLPHPQWKVNLKSEYNKQYTAGGDAGIIDGLFGSLDWRKGGWQGYQAQDFEVIIDLMSEIEIKRVSANFLQDSRSWILMPKTVLFEYSLDGKKFIPLAELKNELAANDNSVVTKSFEKESTVIKARYVKVKAFNYGKLPSWHQGFGGDAFIFIDEISID
jgi:hypothetical protein